MTKYRSYTSAPFDRAFNSSHGDCHYNFYAIDNMRMSLPHTSKEEVGTEMQCPLSIHTGDGREEQASMILFPSQQQMRDAEMTCKGRWRVGWRAGKYCRDIYFQSTNKTIKRL